MLETPGIKHTLENRTQDMLDVNVRTLLEIIRERDAAEAKREADLAAKKSAIKDAPTQSWVAKTTTPPAEKGDKTPTRAPSPPPFY